MARQYIQFDKQKWDAREDIRNNARKLNICCNCSAELHNRAKCYCNPKCRRAFWNKWSLAVVWWNDIRRKVRRRDKYLCQPCKRKGIETRATAVHHIVEIQDGGAEFDEANCESICSPCHKAITKLNREKRKAKQLEGKTSGNNL